MEVSGRKRRDEDFILCKICKSVLARTDAICFYRQSAKCIHLGLRPECIKYIQMNIVEIGSNIHEEKVKNATKTDTEGLIHDKMTPDTYQLYFLNEEQQIPMNLYKIPNPKVNKRDFVPYKVHCLNCNKKIGSLTNLTAFGEQSPNFVGFESTSVIIRHSLFGGDLVVKPPKKKLKWSELCLRINGDGNLGQNTIIPIRDNAYYAKMTSDGITGSGSIIERKRAAMVIPTKENIIQTFQPFCLMSKLRKYQCEAVIFGLLSNLVLYLPTGSGKTIIATKILDEFIKYNPARKAVFLVPKIPLVTQQSNYIRRETDNLNVLGLWGEVCYSRIRRFLEKQRLPKETTLGQSTVNAIVLTPMLFINLLEQKQIFIEDISVVIFDEGHNARKNSEYVTILTSYVYICKAEYRPRLISLSASPITTKVNIERIEIGINQMLDIYRAIPFAPTIYNDDLERHFIPQEAVWVEVEESLQEKMLRNSLSQYLQSLDEVLMEESVIKEALLSSPQYQDFAVNSSAMNRLTGCIRELEETANCQNNSRASTLLGHMLQIFPSFDRLRAIGVTNTSREMMEYFEGKRTSPDILDRRLYQMVVKKCSALMNVCNRCLQSSSSKYSSHVQCLIEQIAKLNRKEKPKVIIFVQRRRMAKWLLDVIRDIPIIADLRPSRFVGHNGFDGMSWEREQSIVLEQFRRGQQNLLVSTSILEEGLDVPECSLVIRFDGVSNFTGFVQSRGRARKAGSRFVIFSSRTEKEVSLKLRNYEMVMADRFRTRVQYSQEWKCASEILSYIQSNYWNSTHEDGVYSHRSNIQDLSTSSNSSNIRSNMSRSSSSAFAIFLRNVDFWRLTEEQQQQIVGNLKCFAEVELYDSRQGLITLLPLENESVFEVYRKICQGIEMEYSPGARFWLQFCDWRFVKNIGSSEQLSFRTHASFILNLVGFCRGEFSAYSEAFIRNEIYFAYKNENPDLKNIDEQTTVKIRKTEFEFEYFVREEKIKVVISLLNIWKQVWIETTPTTMILYFQLLVPPQFYSIVDTSILRKLISFERMSLAFRVEFSVVDVKTEWEIRAILSNAGLHIYDANIPETTREYEEISFSVNNVKVSGTVGTRTIWPSCPSFEAAYALSSFLSINSHVIGDYMPLQFFEVLDDIKEQVIVSDILLNFRPSRFRFVHKQLSEFISSKQTIYLTTRNTITRHFNTVSNVVVTPSKILYYHPEQASSNRMFREFGPQNFMYVHFKDEDLDFLDMSHSTILDRIEEKLKSHLVFDYNDQSNSGNPEGNIIEKKFSFLTCSTSQLRNRSCFYTCLDVWSLRDWAGELRKIRSPAKFLSRLSLTLSSTRDSGVREKPLVVPDIYVEYTLKSPSRYSTSLDLCIQSMPGKTQRLRFTDGIGEVPYTIADQVARNLKYAYVPSAFQIRMGGAKGVLTISDKVENIVLRESMVKFQSSHCNLEIVAVSDISEAFLNRQIITLLSDLGIPDSVFMDMLESSIEDLRILLDNEDKVRNAIKNVLPSFEGLLRAVSATKALISQEPYFHSIIRKMYEYSLNNLVYRARIPVKEGRMLMGILDFTQTLNYGEVFVRVSEPLTKSNNDRSSFNSTRVLQDMNVVVCRNPCHHPGDIRILKCIPADRLPPIFDKFVDCIVFPCQGPRPHPDECSGGDLDGDVYTVIWDERLIPSSVYAPMEFASTAASAELSREVNDNDLINFFRKYIEEEKLGVASNYHLAICDASENGSFDPKAIELAKICSREVDFAKTENHRSIDPSLKPEKYPDFMENTRRLQYQSKKVLGKMYRRCKFLQGLKFTASHGSLVDNSYLTSDFLKFVSIAKDIFNQYSSCIQVLLRMMGIESEVELATGLVLHANSLLQQNIFKTGDEAQRRFIQIQELVKKEFYKAVDTHCAYTDESHDVIKLDMASAWYYVAYNEPDPAKRLLSFPWIVWEYLVPTKNDNSIEKCSQYTFNLADETVMRELDNSIVVELEQAEFELVSSYLLRKNVLDELNMLLEKKYTVVMFGSSELFLFDLDSDIDCYAHCSSKEVSLKEFKSDISQYYSDAELFRKPRIPLVKLEIGEFSVDMVLHPNGPLKTWLFRRYMKTYPFFWPALRILLAWAKQFGLVRRRSGGGHEIFYSSISFSWFFLKFCLDNSFVSLIRPELITLEEIMKENESDLDGNKFWTNLFRVSLTENQTLEFTSPGKVILQFFRHFGDTKLDFSAYSFTDPFDSFNDSQYNEQSIVRIRETCSYALHSLYFYGGNIESILRKRKDHVSTLRLSRALSVRVARRPEFYQEKILHECLGPKNKAVRLEFIPQPNIKRANLYSAEITGDGHSVRRIEKKIKDLEEELSAVGSSGPSRSYYSQDASIVLLEGAQSIKERLGFYRYSGLFHLRHAQDELHQAHLLVYTHGSHWISHAEARFGARFIKQMKNLKSQITQQQGTQKVTAIIRFGYHYLIHMPRSFSKETIVSATIESMEEAFESGRVSRGLHQSVFEVKSTVKLKQVEKLISTGTPNEKYDNKPPVKKNQSATKTGSHQVEKVLHRDTKGLTHSFYTTIPPKSQKYMLEYAFLHDFVRISKPSDFCNVSLVNRWGEYKIHVDSKFMFYKLTTRPYRWFAATLKMRQEIDENGVADGTPDIRFYVDSKSYVEQDHPLNVVLQNLDKPIVSRNHNTSLLEISTNLTHLDEIDSDGIISIREFDTEVFSNNTSGVEMSISTVKTYTLPFKKEDGGIGFKRCIETKEVEFNFRKFNIIQLPVSEMNDFSKKFMHEGHRFVEYLREKATTATLGGNSVMPSNTRY